jgi:ubiquinone/menaquinone biosynthesis C-methylase UbiE
VGPDPGPRGADLSVPSEPPRPTRAEVFREAYRDEEVARDYERARARTLGQRARARLERWLLARAFGGLPRDARLLDVACGTGRLASRIASHAASFTGVDVSFEMLTEARRHGIAGARYIQGDATRLPFPSGSFDVVTSMRFLRHLESPSRIAVFRELARVSRRFVVVELLVREGLVWHTKRVLHVPEWSRKLAVRRPTHEEAKDELARAGLRVLRRHALIAHVSQPHLYVCEVVRQS